MSTRKAKVIELLADGDIGGGSNHVLSLLRHLDQQIFEPYLVCPAGTYLSREAKKIAGIDVVNIPMSSKFDWISILRLRREIEKIEAAGNPFTPVVMHAHGPRAGFFMNLIARPNVVKIYTEHRYDRDYHLDNRINEFVQRNLLRSVCNKSHEVIAVSSSVHDFLRDNLRVRSRIVVIPNAIELDQKTTKGAIKTGHRAAVIGTIGTLNRQKGQRYLIEAMPQVIDKYPLATLEMIGEGPERASLEELIRHHQLQKHITLLGSKPDTEKYLKEWDVFALPSIAETFGIVILEALAASVPVVAAKVGGVPDILTNQHNGLLVPPRDPAALAKAIIAILDSPALAAQLRREGAKTLAQYDWKKVIRKIEEVYLNHIG